MASLTERAAVPYIKMMFIGDSGSGKTGALTSLVKAGYKLRILDMDNGLDSLVYHCKHEGADLSLVEYESFHDKFKVVGQEFMVEGVPKAYVNALKTLTKWPGDGSSPSEWGTDTILVIDSLTAFSRAAFLWAKSMNPSARDPRQWFGSAQESVRTVLEMLTSADFHTNVIVISHVQIMELPDGTVKGYASSIGSALGSHIPKYFNTMLLAESRGAGDNVKRTIRTVPTTIIDAKNPKPFSVPKSLPLETGLATYFEELKK